MVGSDESEPGSSDINEWAHLTIRLFVGPSPSTVRCSGVSLELKVQKGLDGDLGEDSIMNS